jgi:hypothetical protein
MTETSTTITIKNLRAAADLLERFPDLDQPYIVGRHNGTVELNWFLNGAENARATAAEVVRSIGGTWERGEANYSGPLATWDQERDGLFLFVQVSRDEVCERIVTGTEAVLIPAVEAQPERTETREIVEWRCAPLLADGQVSA